MLDLAHIARGDTIACLECGADIPIGASADEQDCLPLNDGDLVQPNHTFGDSTGFVGVCASCLKYFSPLKEIRGVIYDKCMARKEPEGFCFRPILVVVDQDNKFRLFGGKIDFHPIGGIYASGTGNRCYRCLAKLKPIHPKACFCEKVWHFFVQVFVQVLGKLGHHRASW